jgi:hypothetical protein
VADISIAVNRVYFGEDDEKKEEVTFVDVTPGDGKPRFRKSASRKGAQSSRRPPSTGYLGRLAERPEAFSLACRNRKYADAWQPGRERWDASIPEQDKSLWRDPAVASHLGHAKQVSVLTLPRATHFVHLDRAERGRTELIDAIRTFLTK